MKLLLQSYELHDSVASDMHISYVKPKYLRLSRILLVRLWALTKISSLANKQVESILYRF